MTSADHSLCPSVRLMNNASGHCIGRRRTLDEITRWSHYSSARKQAVLAQLETRRAAMNNSY